MNDKKNIKSIETIEMRQNLSDSLKKHCILNQQMSQTESINKISMKRVANTDSCIACTVHNYESESNFKSKNTCKSTIRDPRRKINYFGEKNNALDLSMEKKPNAALELIKIRSNLSIGNQK